MTTTRLIAWGRDCGACSPIARSRPCARAGRGDAARAALGVAGRRRAGGAGPLGPRPRDAAGRGASSCARSGPRAGRALAVAALGDPDDEVRLAAADAAIHLRAAGATDAVAGVAERAGRPRAPQGVRGRASAAEPPRGGAARAHARRPGRRGASRGGRGARAPGLARSRRAAARSTGRPDAGGPHPDRRRARAPGGRASGRAARRQGARTRRPTCGRRSCARWAIWATRGRRRRSCWPCGTRTPRCGATRSTALGRMRAADTVDAIAPFVGDSSPALRLAAFDGPRADRDARRRARPRRRARHAATTTRGALEPTPARDALVARRAPRRSRRCAPLLAGSPSPQAATSAAWVLGALHARDEAPAIVAGHAPGRAADRGGAARARRSRDGRGRARRARVRGGSKPARPRRGARRRRSPCSIRALPDGRAVEPLAAALRDARPTAEERARIATLLGRTGRPARRPAPRRARRARRISALRLAAIDALGALGPTHSAAGFEARRRDGRAARRARGARRRRPPARRDGAGATPGATRARDALMASLDGGDEIDRAAVLTALGGVLARVPERRVDREAGARPSRSRRGPSGTRSSRPSAGRRCPRRRRCSRASPDRKNPPTAERWRPCRRRARATSGTRADAARGPRRQRARPGRVVARLARRRVGRRAPRRNRAAPRTSTRRRTPRRPSAASPRATQRPDLAAPLCTLASDPRAFVRTNALAGLARAGACGDDAPRAQRARERPCRGRSRSGRAGAGTAPERRLRAGARALRANRPVERRRRAVPGGSRRGDAPAPDARCARLRRARRIRHAAPGRLVRDGLRGRDAPGGHDRPPRRRVRAAGPRG